MLYADPSQVLFFELQLHLLVTKFATQRPLLLVQVQEHLDVSVKLRLLLILYNLLDFSLLHDLLLLVLQQLILLHGHLILDFLLDVSELLSLLANVLLHSDFHLLQILLINFSCFPEAEAGLLASCCGIHVDPRSHLHNLPLHESLLDVVSDCDVNEPVVEEECFVLVVVSKLILVLL